MTRPCPPEHASRAADEPPDQALMLRMREDDPKALQALIDRYWVTLAAYARRMLQSSDEAKDVAQEVFVRAWEHRRSWTAGGSVQAYLFQIARNLALLRIRHLKVRERTEPRVRAIEKDVTTPLEDAVHGELQEAVEEALAALPGRRREAFILVRFQGMSLKEAAEIMGISSRTVANHVYLAVSDLEEALQAFLR